MSKFPHYDSDLTEKQWQYIKKFIPEHKKGRKPIDRRRIINAIWYLARTGCQWRYLPKSFPNWKTVYTVFRRFREAGIWQKIHDALCRLTRKKQGKKVTPSAGIIDSQSVDTTEVGGDARGYDAAKNVSGRKRHIIVDTLGLIMAVVIHAADIQDQHGAKLAIESLGDRFKRLLVIFGDSAYARCGLPGWVKNTFGWILQTVLKPADVKGWVLLPKRWIVERTFAWINKFRRNSKDYERNPASSVAMVHIAMTVRMLNYLEKQYGSV
jgi:putative transposase